MHFFDPTVDWPHELIQDEIPDLLYLKANDPLNLSIRLQFPNVATQLSLTTPWVEYRSLDHARSVAMLFIDPATVEADAAVESEIQTLLQNLRAQEVEIGRYRKIQTTYRRDGSPISSEAYIWSWAFRPLAPQQLRSCLTMFESYSTAAPAFRAQQQTTTYRLLPAGINGPQATSAPAALILHHVDGTKEIADQPRFSQELLYDHSVVEKTILGLSPAVQFNDLPGTIWHSPAGMMHPGSMA